MLRKAAFAGLLLAAVAAGAGPTPIVGVVTKVRDGDTIEVGSVAIRLQGLAAPELRDPLGRRAWEAMRELVLGRTVVCLPDGTRSYDRIVARCRLGTLDIAEWLVRRGLGRDCPRYSGGRYRAAEAAQHGTIAHLYPLPRYCLLRPGRRPAVIRGGDRSA